MKNTFLLLILGLALTASAQDQEREIYHDGMVRTYYVHLPEGYNGEAGLPLVFNFHGFGSNATEQRIYTRFNFLADQHNFIAVYPEGTVASIPIGTGNHWNAGFGTDVDDVGFVDKMIDRLWSEYDIDLSRVYATGMSNGGFMSYTLACELSDRIAAIASVTGNITTLQQASCTGSYVPPVLQFHGTADAVVNYEGSDFYPAVPDLMDFWAERHGCQTETNTEELEDKRSSDGSTVTLITYQDCDDVIFYRINDGGHTWPDGAVELPEAGSTNRDINASALIWEFFSRYQHPEPAAGRITSTERVAIKGRVFPTLFDTHLILRDLHGVNAVLMDQTGKVWKQQTIHSNLMTWEVSDLAPGLYLIRLQHPDRDPETLKVIKL